MRKKWFFGILILVVVAIILTIVFINLFKEKDTKALSEKINDVAENSYLTEDSEENKKINEYLTKMAMIFQDGKERTEIKNYKNAINSFSVAIKFFNRELLFSSVSNEYNNHVKSITQNFENAQEDAKKLKNYINETNAPIGNSAYWAQNTWQTSQKFVKSIFDNTREAMSKLGKVYRASVNSKFVNNEYTDIIFDGFDTLSNQVASKISEDATVGTNLLVFTNAYYGDSNEEVILGYAYNDILQNSVKDIVENGVDSLYYSAFLSGIILGRD